MPGAIRKICQGEMPDILADPWFDLWNVPGVDIYLCAYCNCRTNAILEPAADCVHCGADLQEGFLYLGKMWRPMIEKIFVKVAPDEAPRGPEPL